MGTRALRMGSLLGSVVLLGLVALFAYAPIFAVDFFWHLKLGEIIVERGAIPDQDLFSAVHPERPYVQFQWLWDVLAYGAERCGGLHGVRLFSVATMSASFLLLGVVAWRAFASRALAFAFCAFALVLFEDRFQTRPSATALGFVAAALPSWLLTQRTSLRVELVLTFALACLWSNIHGGEALLLSLGMAALAVGEHASAWLQPAAANADARRRARLLLLAAALGSLSSPTFLTGLRDWSWAIQPQLASGNKEWLPTYTMLENGFTPSFVLIALGPSLVLVLYVVEQTRIVRARLEGTSFGQAGMALPFGEWLLCGGMLVLSQHAVRNAFLCLVPLAFMLRRLQARIVLPRTRTLIAAVGTCFLLVAFDDHVLQGYGSVGDARTLLQQDVAPSAFPSELAAFAREARIEGGIFNDGRWGGYLIWALWPTNHVFVDSRQDLTPEMWPLFLAAQGAGTRPQAMADAFRRWGIGLSAFRGPTFPAVRAPKEWQLLFKAGDQELYQHLGARNAQANVARAQAFLAARARNNTAPLEALAVEVGAKRWLAAPYQRFRAEKARRLLESPLAEDGLEGMRLQGSLWFEAGLYTAALPALETVLRLRPDDHKAMYLAALCALALDDRSRVQHWLSRLAERKERLSPQQRNRLRAVDPKDFF